MLTFLLVVGVLVAVGAAVVHVLGKDKVEAEVKAVEGKVVSEVKTVESKVVDEVKKL
jgi:hypothetical protein